MFPLCLQYLLIDFRQTFVTGASWDTDDLITFLGRKVKAHGHTIAVEAHSTRRYRRVQLFLVKFIFCSFRLLSTTMNFCPEVKCILLCDVMDYVQKANLLSPVAWLEPVAPSAAGD